MKVLLLTAATADYQDWAAISRPNKESYCRLYGYNFESVTELPAPRFACLLEQAAPHRGTVDSLIMNRV